MKKIICIIPLLISIFASADPVEDNSFLVEESYNQEPGVVQFINVWQKNVKGQDWTYTFINEIPVMGQQNQFSYELPVTHLAAVDDTKLSDVKLNYRREFIRADKFVTTGRLSTSTSSGDYKKGFGRGAFGYEAALMVSVVVNDKWVQHWNVGYGIAPDAKNQTGDKADNSKYFWAVSNVYLVTDKFNVMLEMTGSVEQETAGRDYAPWSQSNIINPSLRYAVDISDWQLVPGLAFPINVGDQAGQENQFLAYLSIEGPVF